MAQEGSRGHHGNDDASNDNVSAPPATDSGALSPGENSNSGSWTGIPVAEDASKGQDVEEHGSAGSNHSGSGQSRGKRSAAELAAATDDTDEDNMSKAAGKLKVAARDGMGAGVRRKQLSHIITERKRRKRMKGMFADLHALLPHVPEKTDKATIVGEAISFIRVLQGTVSKLEKRKQDRALARRAAVNLEAASSAVAPPNAAQGSSDLPLGWAWLPKQQQKPAAAPQPVGFQTWSGANVVVSVSQDDAYISVCAPRRACVMLMVLSVLEKHRIDVMTAQVASDGSRSMFSIYARVNVAAILQLGSEPPASEDIYKLAVSEIMVRLYN